MPRQPIKKHQMGVWRFDGGYGPVILFENIIEVLHRSMPAILLQSTFGVELHNRRRITGVLVGVDDPRRRMVLSAQRFGEEPFGDRCIAFSREKEVDRRTAGVHRPVQVYPFAFHPHVRLVHPPRVVRRLEVSAQAPRQFRSIPLDPSPDGDVIHREPTLGQKLLDDRYESEKRKYQPIARRMTSGSNWRHLTGRKPKSPEGASNQPITAGLQSCNTSASRASNVAGIASTVC